MRASLARLRLPLVGAPMFLVSGPELVAAQRAAGTIGSLPALNARSTGQLEEWLTELTAQDVETPFAVNLVVNRSNERLDADLEACIRHRVPILITSMGARPEVFAAAHEYGGFVFHDVISDTFARKAHDKGADGLIAVAAGAGGHGGPLSPFALTQEIRSWYDGPLLLGGAISTGRSLLAALAVGADAAYVGSVFITAAEARSSERYREMVITSTSESVVYSPLFSGHPANFLAPSITEHGLDPAALPATLPDGFPRAWSSILSAGQGVGTSHHVEPAAAIIDRLDREMRAAREELLSHPALALAR